MTGRVSWPDGFRTLTADRVKKGFTVVQTVLGFQPDAKPFDGQEANAVGSPWEKDFTRITPRYFDECDLKIEWLESAAWPIFQHHIITGMDRLCAA